MQVECKGMRGATLRGRFWAIALGTVLCLWQGSAAYADDASSWRELETKYIFGFTTGSGIGLEGEKEFTIDTVGRFGKRDGHYAATETKYEFEFTPSQFVQIEFGALGSTHNIGAMTDLEDAAKGFGAHSDQERILEESVYKHVQFFWTAVTSIAGAKP